ncbi:hypothetical protein NIA69_21665 [Gemmiger formicilis]|nr:hypothetical protein [Gemmiger formicilis]
MPSMTAAITRRAAAAWTASTSAIPAPGRCLRQLPQQRGCGNVATDNQPASPETEIHCDDRGCRHLEGRCCCADHVSIDECSCGPECATRAPRRPPNNFIPERMPFSQSGIPFYC